MKSLFFIIIMALHTRDLIAQVTPDDVKIKMKYITFLDDLEPFIEICRGIVIRPKVVMTAAECVNGLSPADLQVGNSLKTVSSKVSNVIIHPLYNERTGSNNFAILILDEILMTNSFVCLSNCTFVSNADLRTCKFSNITDHLFMRMSASLTGESIWELDCASDDGYRRNPHLFRSRQVQMVHCKPISKNSKCFSYYFAHYSSNKKCLPYTNKINIIDLSTSFVNDIYHWVQEQVRKYVHDDSVCL